MAHPPVRALMVRRRAPGRVRNHTPTTARGTLLALSVLNAYFAVSQAWKSWSIHETLSYLRADSSNAPSYTAAKAGAVNSAAGSEERGNRLREVASRCVEERVEYVGRGCDWVDGEFDDGAFLRAIVRQADFRFVCRRDPRASDRRRHRLQHRTAQRKRFGVVDGR
jgi:hypothetical protein